MTAAICGFCSPSGKLARVAAVGAQEDVLGQAAAVDQQIETHHFGRVVLGDRERSAASPVESVLFSATGGCLLKRYKNAVPTPADPDGQRLAFGSGENPRQLCRLARSAVCEYHLSDIFDSNVRRRHRRRRLREGNPDDAELADALRIAERAMRLAGITGDDPFATVGRAADYLRLTGTRAHERVLELLSEADTATDWEMGLQLGLMAVMSEVKRRLGRRQ